jgi:hypothetical protein
MHRKAQLTAVQKLHKTPTFVVQHQSDLLRFTVKRVN